MGTLQIILVLIAAVLASAILVQLIPKVSIPLVQIAIGVCIALVGGVVEDNFQIPPDLFLVMFIAPLLFDEAKKLDRVGFWRNKAMIISLAVGLVIAITLSVGFVLHLVAPSLGLAAAIALGAALGPTDAVAVSSMSKVASLSDKQKSILQGEALLNDASGLVAFQFAIAAALTGSFSLMDAGKVFGIEFFGGIAFGLLVGFLCNLFIAFVQDKGLENETFHVLFDIALPFVVYLMAASLDVSGVLAVVACGIVFQLAPQSTGPGVSKLNIISASTWEVLSFALNGIVFVLLGMMLPTGMTGQLADATTFINWDGLALGLLVALVVIVCRFIWVLLMERVFGDADEISSGLLRHVAILTFAGAKGAITLSIAMTIPFAVSGRSEMIFYASCAIIVTLLLANFLIPLLAPADAEAIEEKDKRERKAYVAILRRVVGRLTEELPERKGIDRIATVSVIEEYNKRIDEMLDSPKNGHMDEGKMVRLRVDALHWQVTRALELETEGKYRSDLIYEFISDTTEQIERVQQHSDLTWYFNRNIRKAGIIGRAMKRMLGIKRKHPDEDKEQMRLLSAECKEYAFKKLAGLMGDPRYTKEDVATVATEYQRAIAFARQQSVSVTQMIRVDDRADVVRMEALRYELAYINEAYSDEKIDRTTAIRFRRNVSMMQLDVADEI